MSKSLIFIEYWVPVLAWMALIFSASSDSASFEHTSRFIAPIVHWLFPHLSDSAVHATVVGIRKMAHLTEFAVLALLLRRALDKPRQMGQRSWKGSASALALGLTALYAASDEFHQLFVPSRQASVTDVLIDTTGGALGLVLFWGIRRLACRS